MRKSLTSHFTLFSPSPSISPLVLALIRAINKRSSEEEIKRILEAGQETPAISQDDSILYLVGRYAELSHKINIILFALKRAAENHEGERVAVDLIGLRDQLRQLLPSLEDDDTIREYAKKLGLRSVSLVEFAFRSSKEPPLSPSPVTATVS